VCVCVCVCVCVSLGITPQLRRKGVGFTTGGESGHCANQPSTHTHTHTHTLSLSLSLSARGSGPVLLMAIGGPDHSLPPQRQRTQKEVKREGGEKGGGEQREDRLIRETRKQRLIMIDGGEQRENEV